MLLTLPLALAAQNEDTETPSTAKESGIYDLDPFLVIGSREKTFELPGSGTYLGPETLDRFKFENVNDLLRQAPGVYVRDEDGFGLFPNISIRGVDTNRSGKVTLMEDGIITAPAPYSAPSAYYSPTAGRMHAIEILKGSSQIQYGPHTTGGVINYRSTPIPGSREGFLEFSYGSDESLKSHLWYGGKLGTRFGTFGGLLELYREESDGFREIKESANGSYQGSDDTGYEKSDVTVKLSYEPDWQRRNYFELKVGYTDFNANETYLGLNPSDLSDNPWDRYAASAGDRIETEHFRTYLRHLLEFDSDRRLKSTLYYNAFQRDWLKLDSVNGGNAAQIILTDPGILRGNTLADFDIKSNDREYYLYGIQSAYDHAFNIGEWTHDLTLGARVHKDKIDRYQDAFYFNNVYAGDFDFANPDMRTGPGDEGDREQESVALALFLRDRIQRGNWTFTPGVRWEYIDWNFIRRDSRNPDEAADGEDSVLAYGLGFDYRLEGRSKLFGGYHRGFSVPSPGGRTDGLDEEISDTFELGYRFEEKGGIYAEAVAFYTHLQDLVVQDSIAGGPGDGNVGDTETLGFELLFGADAGHWLNRSYGIPVRLALTYTDATLKGDAGSQDPESIFAAGEDGNQVPYVPEYQLSITTGLEFERFQTHAVMTYVHERFADAGNSSRQENTNGDPDSRFGSLDSFITLDLSASYQLTDDLNIFANASNVLQEAYVTSRLPLGPRAGAPRLISIGFDYSF